MKKIFNILLLIFVLSFSEIAYSKSYHFKVCEISNAVTGDYIININKKLIEVTLKSIDGNIQEFSDKIKHIQKDQIISEKIKSGKGDEIYFEYYLNAKSRTVTRLQYKKHSAVDMEIFQLQEKRVTYCNNVKIGWDKDEIEEAEIKKEEEQVLKAQKKLKKEQSTIIDCESSNYKEWTNCKGSYTAETGHKYEGLFKNGKIIEGMALFPGGAKYIGEFLNFKPHGYGTFAWKNGDKYFGDWINGQSNGMGTKIWKNGREYSGSFKNDQLHGAGTFYYPDGKKYVGDFINGKRDGEGTFIFLDGTSFIGNFKSGKQVGLGVCVAIDGTSLPCQNKTDTQIKDFSGKDTQNISIVAKKWVRISQYEANTKRGKKIMDKLKNDFEIKASELCASKGNYNVLKKTIEVLDVDETPAYGLETKLKIGINGVIECK
jgi:hypothetical protein